MGLSGSRYCKENLINPEFFTVITLSDSVVQRLPLDPGSSTPLEREMRQQNIDDFWKDRMECLENSYMDSIGLSEQAFNNMEKRILGMTPPVFKSKCPLNIAEVESCLASYPKESLMCSKLIQKLMLCIDTQAQDESRRSCLNAAREKKKRCQKK